MFSRREILNEQTPLTEALPRAQFAERHERAYRASVDEVWESFHLVTWAELRSAKLLMTLRGLGGRGLRKPIVEPPSPVAPLIEQPPHYSASAQIGKPWHPRPVEGPPVATLEQFAEFNEPGWAKFGAEWCFSSLPGGGCLVRTATVCEATDDHARRMFGAYWLVIRAGSGLIRRDILAGVERRLLKG